MAEVKQNILTEGFSGKIGNKIVFRQLGSRTIVSARPCKRIVTSAAQKSQQLRFQQAVNYAKNKLLDPVEKAYYQIMAQKANLSSAFAAAVADFLKVPEVQNVNVNGYAGSIGDVILITVSDNFKITSLSVIIAKADDSLIEKGVAILPIGDVNWKYQATAINASLSGSKVTVIATDKPGNETTFQIVLP